MQPCDQNFEAVTRPKILLVLETRLGGKVDLGHMCGTMVDKKQEEVGEANEWPYGRARTLRWLAKAVHSVHL